MLRRSCRRPTASSPRQRRSTTARAESSGQRVRDEVRRHTPGRAWCCRRCGQAPAWRQIAEPSPGTIHKHAQDGAAGHMDSTRRVCKAVVMPHTRYDEAARTGPAGDDRTIAGALDLPIPPAANPRVAASSTHRPSSARARSARARSSLTCRRTVCSSTPRPAPTSSTHHPGPTGSTNVRADNCCC